MLHTRLDAPVNGDSRPGTIRLNIIEDRIAVSKRKGRPLQNHWLSLFLAHRSISPLGKMLLNLLMGNGGTRIVKRFTHPGAKPGVMLGSILR